MGSCSPRGPPGFSSTFFSALCQLLLLALRIQQARSEAHALALSLFYAPSVTAACICFLELLGLDSLSLRVDVKAANVILSFMSRREEPQHNSIRESLGMIAFTHHVLFGGQCATIKKQLDVKWKHQFLREGSPVASLVRTFSKWNQCSNVLEEKATFNHVSGVIILFWIRICN